MANRDEINPTMEQPIKKQRLDDGHDLSALEKLPRELIWKLFEYTPELVMEYRSMFSTMAHQMDAFVVGQWTVQVVEKLIVHDMRMPNSGTPYAKFGLMFEVADSNQALFWLRLCLTNHHASFVDDRKKIEKKEPMEDTFRNYQKFNVPLNLDDTDLDWTLERINEWIGTRVGLKTHIGKLYVIADELPEQLGGFLVKTVVDRNEQKWSCLDSSRARRATFLFGSNHDDWADVIVEMFKRRTDQLTIVNYNYPEYLTERGIGRLKEKLTKMENKKTWFLGSVEGFPEAYESDAFKDYIVKVNAPPPQPVFVGGNPAAAPNLPKCKQYLTIKHVDRENKLPIWEVPRDKNQ